MGKSVQNVNASRAYIAGFGTSGLLIGSFLLALMVVSAIVAFRGYPGLAGAADLDRLDVGRESATRDAGGAGGVAPRADRAGNAHRGAGTHARGDVRGRHLTGREKEGGVVGGGTEGRGQAGAGPERGEGSAPGDSAPSPGTVGGGAPPPAADDDGGGGGGDSPVSGPTLGSVPGGLGDTVEQGGTPTGDAVGDVTPGLDQTVTDVGQTVGGVVEGTGPAVDGAVGAVSEATGGLTEDLPGGLGAGGL